MANTEEWLRRVRHPEFLKYFGVGHGDMGHGDRIPDPSLGQEPVPATHLNFLKTVNDADQSGKSFIYSPLSITYVLGMVNDAATGQTEQELEKTLGFHEGGIQAVNDYCKKLMDGLPKVDNKVTLDIAMLSS